jgi:hypothetical protein
MKESRKAECDSVIATKPENETTLNEAREMIVALTTTLNNLYDSKWELYKEPIVLDFSMEDLMNTKEWETPSALIRRILRARKELGFPDELLNEQAE